MRASTTTLHVAPQSSFRQADGKPVLVAGPCSAESEEQMLKTAHALLKVEGISIFKAGIWKSRTRPNSFEGVGVVGLEWLAKVKKETGLRTACEVANAYHAEEALAHEVDILCISGRTVVNPFAVQEIAAALRGTNVPVLVNNPVYPDLQLWIGTLERLNQAGLTDLGAIHRGFLAEEQYPYRSHPKWDYLQQLKQLVPELPVLCDAGHMAGKRSLMYPVSQRAIDLGADGLLFESHISPAEALSNPQQQLMPQELELLVNAIRTKVTLAETTQLVDQLDALSQQMGNLDDELLELLLRRSDVTRKISKQQLGLGGPVLQVSRWQKQLEGWLQNPAQEGMDEGLVRSMVQLIHQHTQDQHNEMGSSAVA
ncbi:chorismate mutase [Pontibacter liquoris]|uniref:chorismate mutase n=1 Tax=Pontibacter liquoris TaxID=2905677 RepID=UPI001FA72F99|nr:chorismate mutase [Pontibacter liquoris]